LLEKFGNILKIHGRIRYRRVKERERDIDGKKGKNAMTLHWSWMI